MIRGIVIGALAVALSACGSINREAEEQPEPETGSLEEAAIDSGAIPDLGELSLSGRYEQSSELGADKFCAVADGNSYKVGVVAAFGPTAQCEGRGRATLSGETVKIELTGGDEDCSFDASFDGVELRMPGSVPKSCASYCSDRASFAGVSIPLVEEGDAAAQRVSGREIEELCG